MHQPWQTQQRLLQVLTNFSWQTAGRLRNVFVVLTYIMQFKGTAKKSTKIRKFDALSAAKHNGEYSALNAMEYADEQAFHLTTTPGHKYG